MIHAHSISPAFAGLNEMASMELGAWGPDASGVPDLALASALLESQREYLEQLGRRRPSDAASSASISSSEQHRS